MDDTEYTAIRVSTLRGDLKIPFDVYVKVGEKYIHYCRSGSSFEGTRLDRLKSKKLRKMYIKPDDEIPYRQYLEQSIEDAYNNKSGKPLEIRAEVIQGYQQAESENYMEDPLTEFTYHHLRSSMQRFTEFLAKEPLGAGVILKLKNLDHSVTHHSVNVTALTVAMANDLQLKENAQMALLALGCMVHDIDHYHTNMNLTKPVASMTPEELAAYRAHPINGAQRTQGAKFLDQLVVSLITQHEECSDGTGFPKGLVHKEMNPLVMVAATANAYDRLVSYEGLTHKEAVKNLMIDKLGHYPLNYLKSLQKVLVQTKVL